MPNYQNGKIYFIRSFKTDDIYIGSTTQLLCRRMDGHRQDYKSWINGCKKYCTSFELIKHDDAYIELHKKYPCNSKEELKREEGKYQREMDCVNKRIEGRTRKEWREDNKEIILQKAKEYYEDNKERYRGYNKQQYEEHKEERLEYAKEYRNKNKDEIKQYQIIYRSNTKEKTKEYNKDYREKNKEELKKNKSEKFKCDCGGSWTKGHGFKVHERTKKHQRFLASNDE